MKQAVLVALSACQPATGLDLDPRRCTGLKRKTATALRGGSLGCAVTVQEENVSQARSACTAVPLHLGKTGLDVGIASRPEAANCLPVTHNLVRMLSHEVGISSPYH